MIAWKTVVILFIVFALRRPLASPGSPLTEYRAIMDMKLSVIMVIMGVKSLQAVRECTNKLK